MPADWHRNHLNYIQAANTFENGNAVSYNLRKFTSIFSEYGASDGKTIFI